MTREEQWLGAIAGLDGVAAPDLPVWHYEQMLAAIYDAVTGAADPRPFPSRSWHLDEVLYAVYCAAAGLDDPGCPAPTCRIEEFWYGIYQAAAGEGSPAVPTPVWRIEEMLKGIFDVASEWGSELLTVTGSAPLSLANAIARAIKSLTQTGLCAQASTPTPTSPVDIVCNNGRVVAGNCISDIPDGQGTFITPSELTTNRIYKAFPTDLVVGRSYTVTVTGTNWLILVQQKKPDGTGSANVSGWVTTYDFTPEEGYIYGVAMRRSQDNITPADFNGTLTLDTTDGKPWAVGTPEVLTVGGINLCNPAYYQGDGWYVGSNNTVTTANANGTLVFPCKPNTTYSWWHTAGAGGCRAFELTTDEVTAGQSATWAVGNPAYNDAMTVRKYTTSAYAKLLCVLFARVSDQVVRTIDEQLADFMLVEGDISTATAYEPYVAPQTVNDVPMLLGVGDYADEAEIISGVKTGKVGVYVFTGEEAGVVLNGAFRPGATSAGMFFPKNVTLASSHFKSEAAATSTTNMPDGSIKTNQTADNTMYMKNLACADVAAYQAWLASEYANGTPVIVIYPLATETTEQTTAHHLVTHNGTNTVSVAAEVSPVALAAEYYGTGS